MHNKGVAETTGDMIALRKPQISRFILCACFLFVAGCANQSADLRPDTVNKLFSVRASPIISDKDIPIPPDTVSVKDAPKETSPVSAAIRKYLLASRAVRQQEVITPEGHFTIRTQPADYHADLLAYRDAGFEASRLWCNYYLTRLEEAHSTFQFQQSGYHLGSALISTLMGIYRASATSVAVYATSDTLLSSWLQDYEAYAYLSPSIKKLSTLVYSAQDAYEKGLEGQSTTPGIAGGTPTPPKNWADATNQIATYNQFCLASGMRGLIEDAVGSAQLTFNTQTNTVQVIDQNILNNLRRSGQNNSIIALEQSIIDDQDVVANANTQLHNLAAQNAANVANLAALDMNILTALKMSPTYNSGTDRFDMAAMRDQVLRAQANLDNAIKATPQDAAAIMVAQDDLARASANRTAAQTYNDLNDTAKHIADAIKAQTAIVNAKTNEISTLEMQVRNLAGN